MTWTKERRQRQAELIQTWRPWESSTGPRTVGGKAAVSANAYKGGHRQRLRELASLVNKQVRQSKELLACL